MFVVLRVCFIVVMRFEFFSFSFILYYFLFFSSFFLMISSIKISSTNQNIKLLKSLFSSQSKKNINNINNKKIFVIVESPAKARTLNKFLPPNYIIDSCIGHIRDLGRKQSLDSQYQLKSVIPELNLRFYNLFV